MTSSGPDFIGLQVRDVERSAAFYESHLGMTRAQTKADAVVFATEPIPFAVRAPLPGTDLTAGPAGLGVGLWMHAGDAQEVHDRLVAAGVPILAAPVDGPFGRQFVCRDPDGYAVTVHDGGR